MEKKKSTGNVAGSEIDLKNSSSAAPAASAAIWNTHNLLWTIGLLFIASVFLIFKMYNLNYYAGDESIYISQGRLVSEGLVPFKDFSMAHPPLQSLFIATLFKLSGYNFILFRLIPVFWSLLAAVLLAIIVHKELGVVASIAAMALYVLAYEPMRASIHFTGVNMTIALLMFALLAQRNRRIIQCAAFCVLAVFTRLYALPVVLSIFILTWIQDKKEAYRFTGYGVCIGASLFLIFGLWSGFGAFIQDVFLFQAQKTTMKMEQVTFMRDAVLFHNAVPLILFVLGAVTAIIFYLQPVNAGDVRKKNNKVSKLSRSSSVSPLVWYSVGSVIFILMILLNLKRVWMYYYVLAFPFAAIAGGWMFSQWIHFIYNLINRDKSIKLFWNGSRSAWVVASIIIFSGLYVSSSNFEKRLDYYKEAMRNPAKRTVTYDWIDGKLPGWINQTVKKLFWKDTRIVGKKYSSFTYYLWHSSRVLDIADSIVSEVQRRTSVNDRIFGDSGTVPLVSLLSKREIAGDEVDTNIEQFRSGNINAKELVQRINVPSTKLIILRDKFGVANVPEIQQLVAYNYKEVKSFRSKTGFTIRIFERLPA